MDLTELKKEQLKLAPKVVLQDGFGSLSSIKSIAGVSCVPVVVGTMPGGKVNSGSNAVSSSNTTSTTLHGPNDSNPPATPAPNTNATPTPNAIAIPTPHTKLLACVVVCEFPSMKLLESKTYLLDNPLPYRPGFQAYREMPAIIEAYNQLELEPEREPDLILVSGAGIAHPRKIGIASHLGLALNRPTIGITESLLTGTIQQGKIIIENEIRGFEIRTREYSNTIYVSPGHLVALGTVLTLIPKTIHYPHKLPEPLHLAHKLAKRKGRELLGGGLDGKRAEERAAR